MEPTIKIPHVQQVTAVLEKNAAGEDVITLPLDDTIIGPTQGATPEVSARKSQSGRDVKRSLSYSSNTTPEYNEANVSDEANYPAYLY